MVENNPLALGDLHTTEEAPRSRIDDYADTLLKKIMFVLDFAEEHDCFLLQAGDFLNLPNPSYHFFTRMVNIIKRYRRIQIYTVYGQHDLKFRRKENTALLALEAACDNFHIVSSDKPIEHDRYMIYGAGYGEEIPVPDSRRGFANILLIHKMVVKDYKVWAGQTEYVRAIDLLKNNDYQFIVSGDNHTGFIESYSGKVLINCGSIMRSSIAQINHKPFFAFIDRGVVKTINIPIASASKVFDIDKLEREKEKNAELDSFINGLSSQKEMGLDFEDNLETYFRENKISKEVRNCIRENLV